MASSLRGVRSKVPMVVFGSENPAAEEEDVNHRVYRQQDRDGVFRHVAQKRGRFDAIGLCDCLDHEVWCIADIGHGSEEHGRDGNGLKVDDRFNSSGKSDNRFRVVHIQPEFAHGGGNKIQVCGGVVQDA